VYTQIVGPKKDRNEIEIQESQLIGNQIVDTGHTDQDQQHKNLFEISDQVIFKSFHLSILYQHSHPKRRWGIDGL
jgi:hypothetical protein